MANITIPMDHAGHVRGYTIGDAVIALQFLKESFSISDFDEGYFEMALIDGFEAVIAEIRDLKKNKEFYLYCRLKDINTKQWIEEFKERWTEDFKAHSDLGVGK